jgi:hypothetical protein
MALLRSAGAGHLIDRVVLIRLGIAAAFIVVWIGGALSPQAVTSLMAAVAVGAGLAIERAWGSVPDPVI